MATYFIGDVHGCYEELKLLLDKINYDSSKDRLFFTGDLVGRGPQPLATLKLAHSLLEQNPANQIVLGNHDLHLISLFCGGYKLSENPDHTLMQVLDDEAAGELIEWLIHLPLIHHDPEDNLILVHAGIPHIWTLEEALENATIVQQKLRNTYISCYSSIGNSHTPPPEHLSTKAPNAFKSNQMGILLASLYGNSPTSLNDVENCVNNATEYPIEYATEYIRTILNYFTRMRLCNSAGAMELTYNGPAETIPTTTQYQGYSPWFSHNRNSDSKLIVFGHWAAIAGVTGKDNIWGLDYGCAWGKQLASKRLEDAKLFLVDCVSI